MSVCTPIDYSSHEVGGFVLAPLTLMALSVPWEFWFMTFAVLVWLAAATHMFTGWRPRRR